MPTRISLRKNIFWNSSGSLVYLSFQWLVTYLVVVLLGFKDAGVFSLAIAITSVAFAFSLYGIRGYQVSDIARKYSDKSYVVARVATCVLAIAGILVYLGIYQYDLYTTLCIIAYLLYKISEAFVDVYHGIIQRGMRMDFIGKSFILRGIVTNLLFIICAVLTKDLLSAIVIQTIASFALIAWYDHRKVQDFYKEPNTTSFKKTFSLLIECLPLAVYVFLSNLVMSVPRISLESMKGSEILGIYASIAIPAAIIQVVAGYIFSPVLTIFAEHVNKKNFAHFYKLLVKTTLYIVAFSVITIVGGWLFGKFGLVLLFGEKIEAYTYLFVPILYISSLTALSWFIGLMLTVLREFRGLIIASVVAVLVCVIGSGQFINSFGLNGVNFILIIALILQIILMCIFMIIKVRSIQKGIRA